MRSRVVLGSAVQEDVEVRADVHVAELELPREGEDERDVLLLGEGFADDFDLLAGAGGDAAG